MGAAPHARTAGRRRLDLPYDSHWNDLGTWVVYEQIIERIAAELPGVHPQPRDRFDAVRVHGLGNDLALVLSLGHLLPGERLNFVPRVPRRARWAPYEGPLPFGTTAGTISEIDDPALPRAVVFHDSFGESLRPFLAEHFARAVYTWQAVFDPALVERERPAVVVQEIVERSLMQEHPSDPEELRRATATHTISRRAGSVRVGAESGADGGGDQLHVIPGERGMERKAEDGGCGALGVGTACSGYPSRIGRLPIDG